jgi:hypothetical protein
MLTQTELLLIYELLTFMIERYEGTDALSDEGLNAFVALHQKCESLLLLLEQSTASELAALRPSSDRIH